ncbi:NnrS family protein [Hydrogenimonas sp.]
MNFQTAQNGNRFAYFLSQPHQPFFFMGIVWSVVAMLLFMLAHKGVLPFFGLDATLFHAYTMLFVVFSHFFHGFLLTTFPRFCMTQPVPQKVYLTLFGLYEAGAFLFLAGALFFAPLAVLGVLATFAGHLFAVKNFKIIYEVGGSPDKKDPFWLLVAHASGLAAHLIFVVGTTYAVFGVSFNWLPWATGLGVYLYLLFLTFVVAQRMVPFFSHVMANKPEKFLPIAFTLFALKAAAFALDLAYAEALVTVALAAYLLKEFLAWKLPVFTSPAILWVLHLGLFWLPAGLFIDAVMRLGEVWLQTSFLYAGLHLLAVGFVTTILIGFGTRVTLGHSGQVPHADRVSVALFWFTETVVLARFAYSMGMGFGLDLGWLFDLSATMWMGLFLAWGWKFGPTLMFGKRGA